MFQKGTYWVYQNDSTLAIDSVGVDATYSSIITASNDIEGCNDPIPYAEIEKFITVISPNFAGMSSALDLMGGALRFAYTYPQVSFCYFTEDNTYTEWDTAYCKWIDTMPVNGKIYTDVVRNNISILIDLPESYYVAPHYGIIRREIYHTPDSVETWSLLRSKIIQ